VDKINKLSLPVVILLASIILGAFFYASEVSKQKSIERQQEMKLQEDGRVESAKSQESKALEKPVYVQPKQNKDLILVNYKLDAQDGEGLRNDLLLAAYNSPSQMCPSIIAERTTRQHLYYLVLDNIAKLKSKYGKYRNSISYIDNNLAGLDGIIQIVKDKCASLGVLF